MIKGRTKVIVDRNGNTKIQEELDGNVRVFTTEQWEKEQKKRAKAVKKGADVPVSDEKSSDPSNKTGGRSRTNRVKDEVANKSNKPMSEEDALNNDARGDATGDNGNKDVAGVQEDVDTTGDDGASGMAHDDNDSDDLKDNDLKDNDE